MYIRTPQGTIDPRALQQRAIEQLKTTPVTDDIKFAIGMLGVMIDELEDRDKQLEDLRATMTY